MMNSKIYYEKQELNSMKDICGNEIKICEV